MQCCHLTRRVVGLFGALLLIGPSAIGLAQQQPPPVPKVDAKNLRMQPEDLPEGGRVIGDSSQPGVYVVRNLFRAGRGSRPHFHDQDRYITVIKGTWWTGEGDVYQPDKMIPIKEGGFMFHPAGYHHYDGAKDEDVIVQIMGIGPVRTTQTEVDANGQPVGRGAAPAPGQ